MEVNNDIIKKDLKRNIYLNICKYIFDKNYDAIRESYNILTYLDDNLDNDNIFSIYCHLYLCIMCFIDDIEMAKLIFELFIYHIHENLTYWNKDIYLDIMTDLKNLMRQKHYKYNEYKCDDNYGDFDIKFPFIDISECLSLIIDNDNIELYKLFCENNLMIHIEKDYFDKCCKNFEEYFSSKSNIQIWSDENKEKIEFKNNDK